MRNPLRNWRAILDIVTTIAVIVVCAVVVLAVMANRSRPARPPEAAAGPPQPAPRREPPPAPKDPVSLDGASTRGNRSARLGIIVYSDFECPFCARFAREMLPEIEKRYVDSGKALLAFRHLPLAHVHPHAIKAAEAAECAGRQGKFWEMHDRMFTDPGGLDDIGLHTHADAIGLDRRQFAACFEGQATRRVRDDMAGAGAVGVSATPTYFVGFLEPDGHVKVAQRFEGLVPLPGFTGVLDQLLAQTSLK